MSCLHFSWSCQPVGYWHILGQKLVFLISEQSSSFSFYFISLGICCKTEIRLFMKTHLLKCVCHFKCKCWSLICYPCTIKSRLLISLDPAHQGFHLQTLFTSYSILQLCWPPNNSSLKAIALKLYLWNVLPKGQWSTNLGLPDRKDFHLCGLCSLCHNNAILSLY
jgi:hypothetical protein